eukprot:CAMPEP_0183560682 /NCGR_PEP_ID=MMETSP0371-20130417/95514_1 /TAXON_ID=268820 /ORGANISM="Peridinium aciculiferum, Strain PAER-2" /LENGTH=110 /DNA_ID=CAMNT_0025768963 /DNA_START=55 /DNA_END=384 /DNA_ORIENTATION=+
MAQLAPGDIGNICRCLCGDGVLGNTTILVSAANGCKDCTVKVCREQFTHCDLADIQGGSVSVHCIDRSALTPRIAVASLLVIVFLLVVTALGRERCRPLRKLHEAIGHRD